VLQSEVASEVTESTELFPLENSTSIFGFLSKHGKIVEAYKKKQ